MYERINRTSTLAAIVGALSGLFLVGPSRVNPFNSRWISTGDRLGNQISWNYFRRTEILQWPLNVNPNNGLGWNDLGHGTNQLVSLPLKYLSQILPGGFQFMGIWICLCFALQAYFAAKIFELFSQSRLKIITLASNFVIFPIFVIRIGLMGHSQAGAQWVLLCGFYLALNNEFRHSRWALILGTSLLIDIYLSVMLIAIIYAVSISRLEMTIKSKVRYLAETTLVTLLISLTMLFMQGFLLRGATLIGTGFFRFSPIAFVNPQISDQTSYSLFFNHFFGLKSYNSLGVNTESFLYLGFGFISVGIVVTFFRLSTIEKSKSNVFLALFVVCVLLFAFGLSNRVAFAGYEFSYWWPSGVHDLRQVFRSATRFGWPLAYLFGISICIRILVIESFATFGKYIASLLLVINLIDVSPLLRETYNDFRNEDLEALTNRDRLRSVFSSFSAIKFFPVFDLQLDDSGEYISEKLWRRTSLWEDVLAVASELNMPTNFTYTSRPVGEVIRLENNRILKILNGGAIEQGDLYVFISFDEFESFRDYKSETTDSFSVGGLYFLGIPN